MKEPPKRPSRREKEEIRRQFWCLVESEDDEAYWSWVNGVYRPETDSEKKNFQTAWDDALRVQRAARREKNLRRVRS
jgi:hypothetical protein